MPPPLPAWMTATDLRHVRIPEKPAELVRGKLVVRDPAGLRHGRVAMDLARRLADHVDARGLGQVYAAETGFALARDPDTVRAPDIAFIRGNRLDRKSTSELQSQSNLVCRLLLEKKKKKKNRKKCR